MNAFFKALALAVSLPLYLGAEEISAHNDRVGEQLEEVAANLKQIEGKPGIHFIANENGKIFIGKTEISDDQFSAICKELVKAFPDNPIHLTTSAAIPHQRHRRIIGLSSEAGIKGIIWKVGEPEEETRTEGGADQPATVRESKSEGKEKPKLESDGRSQ